MLRAEIQVTLPVTVAVYFEEHEEGTTIDGAQVLPQDAMERILDVPDLLAQLRENGKLVEESDGVPF